MKTPIKIAAAALGAALMTTSAIAAPLKTAVFAGGCFWTMEHDMEPIPGVVRVVVGYAGGTAPNPNYDNHKGYLESVRVTYDAGRISYHDLVARYLRVTDPTDAGGAACDRGQSYRPAIFVTAPQERQAALAAIAEARPHVKGRIITPVLPAGRFYVGEDYHQHYAHKNPVAYNMYRVGCGKDARLRQIWGR
jgi:peptide-methionine (S)-S-oxide reductase